MKDKWTSRKFLLLLALFVMAQIFKWQCKIGDWPWIIASAIGVFGFAVINAWLLINGVYKKKEQ